MYGLDLFTGIGGITIALQDYVIPLAYCEIDSYAQSTLLQRMQEGNLPKAPIWDDIRTFPAEDVPRIDIVYGGFPCQDISIAGRQKGLEGKRSGLFFEILRILDETKAPFIFLENVPNIRTKGAERVCKELAERGYDCRWCNISASDVGARHKRERWFLLAYSNSCSSWESEYRGCRKEEIEETSKRKNNDTTRVSCGTSEVWLFNKGYILNTNGKSFEGLCKSERVQKKYPYISNSCGGSVEPEFCRIFNDVSHKLDSVKMRNSYAKKTEGRAKEEMSFLQEDNEAKEIWNSFRRHECVSKKKVLFSELYGELQIKGLPYTIGNWEALQRIQEEQMRNLQLFTEFMYSSYRREQLQQQSLKLEDALLFMSYNFASSTRGYCKEKRSSLLSLLRRTCLQTWSVLQASHEIQKIWESLSEEEKNWAIMASIFGRCWQELPLIPRMVDGLPNRIHRVKSLGNAVVPLQVKKAFKILLGIS